MRKKNRVLIGWGAPFAPIVFLITVPWVAMLLTPLTVIGGSQEDIIFSLLIGVIGLIGTLIMLSIFPNYFIVMKIDKLQLSRKEQIFGDRIEQVSIEELTPAGVIIPAVVCPVIRLKGKLEPIQLTQLSGYVRNGKNRRVLRQTRRIASHVGVTPNIFEARKLSARAPWE